LEELGNPAEGEGLLRSLDALHRPEGDEGPECIVVSAHFLEALRVDLALLVYLVQEALLLGREGLLLLDMLALQLFEAEIGLLYLFGQLLNLDDVIQELVVGHCELDVDNLGRSCRVLESLDLLRVVLDDGLDMVPQLGLEHFDAEVVPDLR